MENEFKNENNEVEKTASGNGAKRRLRMGGYSTILIVAVIAAAVIINMIVGILPSKYRVIDLTNTGMYDISQQSKDMIANVKDDVTVYLITTDAARDLSLSMFLENYASLSSKIKVETVDPNNDPTFISEHEVSNMNSLVVVSEKRSKTVDFFDIYEYSPEQQQQYYSYQYYLNGGVPITESGIAPEIFDADNELTAAVDYVTTDILPIVYLLTGHGESAFDSEVGSIISSQSVEMAELNLLSAGTIPVDADIVVINAPAKDLSDAEADALIGYIDDGGKLIVVTDMNDYSTEKMPNLTRAVKHCGLTAKDGVILEGDSDRVFTGANKFMLVEPLEGSIVSNAAGIGDNASSYSLVLGYAHPIVKDEDYEGSMIVTPIVKTTKDAYLIGASDEYREKEEGDESGEFYIGAISHDTSTGAFCIWYSTPYINSGLTSNYNNYWIFMYSITAICEKPSTVAIDSIDISSETLVISESDANILTAIIMVIVPAAVLAAGLAVYIRRRVR